MFVYQIMVYTTAVSVVGIIQSLKILSHFVRNMSKQCGRKRL